MLIIDAANVIGSRPDGWWRDRPGAAQRFIEQLHEALRHGRLAPPIVVVLEGRARQGAGESDCEGLRVVHAPHDGDATIAALAQSADDALVVTADRELATRVMSAGAGVEGPRWLLDRLG
jgi:uncharacterized protein YaiI (UPF0178 family)